MVATRTRHVAFVAVRRVGCSMPRGSVQMLRRDSPDAVFHPATSSVGSIRRGCASHSGLDSIRAPAYEPVNIIDEDPSTVFADMPTLTFGGAKRSGSGGVSTTEKNAARLGMNIPMDVEGLAGVAQGKDAGTTSTSGDMPKARFGQLPNGVRIAAVDRLGMCASVGLFVHAGSRYETAESACIPHVLELMAFRSSAHLGHVRTLSTLEQLGAAASCRVGREDILYQFDVLREYVPVLLPLMLANVLCPAILEEEIQLAREAALEMRNALEENTESLLNELLHTAAYKGNTLGHSLYADEKDISKFTAENIREYISRACTPDRLIIVGINIGFDDLSKWTARCFAEFDSRKAMADSSAVAASARIAKDVPAPAPEVQKAIYTGGDLRMARPNPLCHLMLGWEVEGGWNGPMLGAITVLQMFLGGGGSFSTGGPGKGMHTRLYTEVLNRHHWVESCQASSVMYADSGLFTIYATVEPRNAGDFVKVISKIFTGFRNISQEELQRAKNTLKSSIHMHLEMRAVMMEDIGRQLTLSGRVGTTEEFSAIVDKVTVDDMVNAFRKCLESKPTVVAYGAIDRVPAYEQIEKMIKEARP